MERIGMSPEERDWRDGWKRARDQKMRQREAAEKMGVSERWVRQRLRRRKTKGDAVVVHGLRGRASHRQRPGKTQRPARVVLREPDGHDFGPTLAAQPLGKLHPIQGGQETVRGWMIDAGRWQPGPRTIHQVQGGRPRRSGFGEWAPGDTWDQDWREGRSGAGPVRYRVRRIDAATSGSGGRFVEREATPFNRAVGWESIENNGRRVEVYTERDARFPVARRPGEREPERPAADRVSPLGRALRELGMGSMGASSPQAQGRGERSCLTAQDRLVKPLRRAQGGTLEDAHAFLENQSWPEWHAGFARPVTDVPHRHRPWREALDLAALWGHREPRVLAHDYTVSCAGQRYQILREPVPAGRRQQPLRVELRFEGDRYARYQGRYLTLETGGARVATPSWAPRKPPRPDHNASGQSTGRQGFLDPPAPPLWRSLGG